MRKLGFYLLLIFVFTIPWQDIVAIGGSKTLSSVIGFVAVLCAVFGCALDRMIFRPPAFVFALSMLVVWKLTTYFWSLGPEATLGRVLTMIQILAMVWLITELCASEKERLALMQVFVLGCVVVCLLLVRAYLVGQVGGENRYIPTNLSINEAADFIAVGISMALLSIASQHRGPFLWVNVLYIPLAVFSVILTASRSGFIVTCLALTGVFFVLRQARPLYRLAWTVVILGVTAGVFFGNPGNHGLEENIQRVTFSGDTYSLGTLTGRTTIWSAGLQVFENNPLAGTGAGTFGLAVEEQLGYQKAAHNMFVEVAVGTGIIGLMLLAAVLATVLVAILAWRDYRTVLNLTLFLVVMATSLVTNVVTHKAFWFALAILSLNTAVHKRQLVLGYPDAESTLAAAQSVRSTVPRSHL